MIAKSRNYARGVKTKNIVFRVTDKELKEIKRKAKKLTGENISDFIRIAALSYVIKG